MGHINGGLALVCVLVACFFAAISGSGPPRWRRSAELSFRR
ncbi:MAG: hypothetical protein V8S93_08870 [Lachnospiraceae bacterium]